MEEEENPNAVSSTWPPPPPFWKDFTPANVSCIEELRKLKVDADAAAEAEKGIAGTGTGTETGTGEGEGKSRTKNKSTGTTERLVGLPRELRNLQPPPEPSGGTWRLFGATYKLVDDLPRLEDQGVRRLFPNPEERDQDGKHFDRATILKRLAKSLLLNFLELMGIFSVNPAAVCLSFPFLALPLPVFFSSFLFFLHLDLLSLSLASVTHETNAGNVGTDGTAGRR